MSYESFINLFIALQYFFVLIEQSQLRAECESHGLVYYDPKFLVGLYDDTIQSIEFSLIASVRIENGFLGRNCSEVMMLVTGYRVSFCCTTYHLGPLITLA